MAEGEDRVAVTEEREKEKRQDRLVDLSLRRAGAMAATHKTLLDLVEREVVLLHDDAGYGWEHSVRLASLTADDFCAKLAERVKNHLNQQAWV
jgi:hypothetical protein